MNKKTLSELTKAWKEYKESLKIGQTVSISGVLCLHYLPPSFEGFMDYLVSKEKKGKRGKQ